MRGKKYVGYAVVFLVLLAAVIPGCSKKTELPKEAAALITEPRYTWEDGNGTELSLWTSENEADRSYMKKAIACYEQTVGNKIKIVEYPKQDMEKEVSAAFQGRKEQPDIILTYGGTNVDAYHPDENFYDFTDAVWVYDLTDTALNQAIYHGRVIGLPHWEASISGTLYQKELFRKYNLQVPKTAEEFMEVCETLLQNGITPMYLPGGEISMLLYQFPLDTIVEEEDILNALNDGSIGYADIPEMTEVVNWYREMARKGYFGETYLTDDWNGMNEAMKSRKYAMMFCWDTWLYTDFDGDAEAFGIMPAFMGVPKEGTFEGPNLALLVVNKHSKNLNAALDFLTFMADPYHYNQAFEGIYTAPVFKNQVSGISTPQYIQAERLIERNFRNSTAWLRIRGFSQMDASCILDYMSGKTKTARECLENMDLLREQRAKE